MGQKPGTAAKSLRLVFDSIRPQPIVAQAFTNLHVRRGTRMGSGAAGSSVACCTVGGTATPAARRTAPQVPWTSLRSRNCLRSCSTSTICSRSRSILDHIGPLEFVIFLG